MTAIQLVMVPQRVAKFYFPLRRGIFQDSSLYIPRKIIWALSKIAKDYENSSFEQKIDICLRVTPVRIRCTDRLPAPAHHAKCSACLRKYARYGKTSHRWDNPLYTFSGIFFSIPENTKTFKDSIKIDQVRPKTMKTPFVRGST